MSLQSTEKTIAKALLSIGAVFLRPAQPFTWASGIKSPICCTRLTLTDVKVRNQVEEGLAAIVHKHFRQPKCLWVLLPQASPTLLSATLLNLL